MPEDEEPSIELLEQGMFAVPGVWRLARTGLGFRLWNEDKGAAIFIPLDECTNRVKRVTARHFDVDRRRFSVETECVAAYKELGLFPAQPLEPLSPAQEAASAAQEGAPAATATVEPETAQSEHPLEAKLAVMGTMLGIVLMVAFPTGGSLVVAFIVGAILPVAGGFYGKALGMTINQFSARTPECVSRTRQTRLGFALGLTGLLAWLIPPAGLGCGIAGWILAAKTRRDAPPQLVAKAMLVSLIAIGLSAANGYLGAVSTIRAMLQ